MSNTRLQVTTGKFSSRGRKAHNQDALGVSVPSGATLALKGVCAAVADGISSSAVSAEASQSAVNTLLSDYYSTPQNWSPQVSAERVIKASNAWLYALGQKNPTRFERDQGYVCTLSAMIVRGDQVHLLHAGDSQIARLRAGNYEVLTTAHRREYSEEVSYLTRALGIKAELELEVQSFGAQPGDVYLLSTDGVHEVLSSEQISTFLAQWGDQPDEGLGDKGLPQRGGQGISSEDTGQAGTSSSEANADDQTAEPDSKTADSQHGEPAADTLVKPTSKPDLDADHIAKALCQLALNAGSTDNLSALVLRIDTLGEPNLEDIGLVSANLPVKTSLQPRQVFDGFMVLKTLHFGHRSHVYLVRDETSGERMVLKTPSAEHQENRDYLDQLLLEEWTAQRIDSPHVAQAPKLSRAKQFLYTLSEYAEGDTLRQWMTDHPKPNLDQVRRILTEIGMGLRAIHRQQIIHQDIRPENIMIADDGVKIIDLGSAWVPGVEDLKRGGIAAMPGTAQYSAPEYFVGLPAGQQIDARADVFSLSVIAYEMLTGHLPFGLGIPKASSLQDINRLKYRPIKAHRTDLPDWIDRVLIKGLSLDRRTRFSEVAELIHALTKPSGEFTAPRRLPLIEKNPLKFWKSLCLLLLICVLVLLLELYQLLH